MIMTVLVEQNRMSRWVRLHIMEMGGSCTWDEDVTRRTLAEGLSHCL